MRLKIGNSIRPNRESVASISYQSVFDSSRRLSKIIERWNISGRLVPEIKTQSAMSAELSKLNRDLISGVSLVYLEEGSNNETKLKMDASRAIYGPVLVSSSIPNSPGDVYASSLSWTATYEAEYLASSASNILDFSETIQETAGGIEYAQVGGMVNPSRRQIVNFNKPWTYVQSGRAVGLLAKPTPPPPIWPFALIKEFPDTTKGSPRVRGLINQEFETSWRYEYSWHVRLYGDPHTYIS